MKREPTRKQKIQDAYDLWTGIGIRHDIALRLAKSAYPREPLIKELRAIISSVKAWIYLRQIEREKDRIAAGICTKEEQREKREEWIKQEYGK